MIAAVAITIVAGSGAVASGASGVYNCFQLQFALNNAQPGDVLTLTGICTGQSFTLPSKAITLRGDPTDGADGFDGNVNSNSPILSGTGVGATTVRDLLFKNASDTTAFGGAAIRIEGSSSPTISGCSFFGNTSTGFGGAVSISTFGPAPATVQDNTFGSQTSPNRSTNGEGGALSVSSGFGLVLSRNTFVANTAPRGGGGASIYVPEGGPATISDNLFQDNVVGFGGGGGGAEILGGGCDLDGCHAGGTVMQSGNTFSDNFVYPGSSGAPSGGGELFSRLLTSVTSRSDRFLINSIQAANGTGGGLAVVNTAPPAPAYTFRVENLVAAGNLAPGGGGGIHASDATLNVLDSTVAGNRIGAGASGAGVSGAGSSTLSLTNSIVYGDDTSGGTGAEIAGFSSASVSFTDTCVVGTTTPYPGTGNICLNPQLVNPSGFPNPDVHETASSPTIDRGSNALVPAGLTQDFEGNARVSDGNNDSVAVVDMGADERPSTPTAAVVTFFSASYAARGVLLNWRTGSQVELAGFNLYRKDNGKLVKLNHALIPNLFGGTPTGHAYSWLDRRVPRANGKVRYRLQAVSLSGKRSWVGSAVVAR